MRGVVWPILWFDGNLSHSCHSNQSLMRYVDTHGVQCFGQVLYISVP